MGLIIPTGKSCRAVVEGLAGSFNEAAQEPILDLFASRADLTLTRAWYPREPDSAAEAMQWLIKGDARFVTIAIPLGFNGHVPTTKIIIIKRCWPNLHAVQKPEPAGSQGFERVGVWFHLADVEGWR